MGAVLAVAMRNVCRHPRRTVITSAAVALGVVFIVVAAGFLDFTFRGLRQSIVYGGLGHVQVLPARDETGARLDGSLLGDLQSMLGAESSIETVAPRLEFQGLVSAGATTLTFSGIAVDPTAERRVRALATIAAGRWFTGGERTPQALLGTGLAARLGVRPRDIVSLVTYSDAGNMTAAEVQVAGTFESGVVEYDARTLLVPLAIGRALMDTTGASGVAVVVRGDMPLEPLTRRVGAWLARRGADARVLRWDELSPVYGSVVRLYEWILDVFLLVVTLVVVLGIANTMSMAVVERIVEVATLRALGFGPWRIATMFVAEAVLIGALGAAAGVVLGALACAVLSAIGIDMPPPPGHSQGYVAEVHLVPRAFVGAAAIALGAAVVAAVGPAVHSVRREVAEALRAS